MVKEKISNEEHTRDQVLKTIQKKRPGLTGLTITKIAKETKFGKGKIRIALAHLLGSNKIAEERVGQSKLYYEI